jgi:hypothetical protein
MLTFTPPRGALRQAEPEKRFEEKPSGAKRKIYVTPEVCGHARHAAAQLSCRGSTRGPSATVREALYEEALECVRPFTKRPLSA